MYRKSRYRLQQTPGSEHKCGPKNIGEVIVDGEDRYGEGVNVPARLEQLAFPGGICVSGKVAKEVEKKLAFGFDSAGPQKVRNIEELVDVYHVRLDAPTHSAQAREPPPVVGTWTPSSHRGGRSGRVVGAVLSAVDVLPWWIRYDPVCRRASLQRFECRQESRVFGRRIGE